jgi:hypothetical protein
MLPANTESTPTAGNKDADDECPSNAQSKVAMPAHNSADMPANINCLHAPVHKLLPAAVLPHVSPHAQRCQACRHVAAVQRVLLACIAVRKASKRQQLL